MSRIGGKLGGLVRVNHQGLARLPIPALEDTLRRYLESIKPLTTEKAFLEHKAVVEKFANGAGPKLQESLVARDKAYAEAGEHPYFHFEGYWDAAYLEARCPNQVHISPFYILEAPDKADKDQASNAARFLHAAAQWLLLARQGLLKDDGGDMSQLAMFLGTTRIPCAKRDTLEFHGETSSHIVVQCGGTFHQLDILTPSGEAVPYDVLRQALRSIFESSKPITETRLPPVAALTTEDRDVWASARQVLLEDEQNRATLGAIDSALFMVALDHGKSSRDAGIVSTSKSLIHGSSVDSKSYANRWFDKHQLVVDEAGVAGMVFEHSFSDGGSWNKALSDMWSTMAKPAPTSQASSAAAVPKELKFNLSEASILSIAKAEEKLSNDFESKLALEVLDFDEFGKEEIKAWGLSPDAVLQQAFQAGYQKVHGAGVAAPAYEACAMRGFFHGRTETIRSCTTEASGFAQALVEGRPKDEVKARLEAAVKVQSLLAKAASAGDGIDRHLMSLRNEATVHNVVTPSPATTQLFDEPVFSKSGTWTLSTSNVTAPFIRLFGFGPVTSEGYGLGYLTQKTALPICVTSWKGSETSASDMKRGIDWSLKQMRDLFR